MEIGIKIANLKCLNVNKPQSAILFMWQFYHDKVTNQKLTNGKVDLATEVHIRLGLPDDFDRTNSDALAVLTVVNFFVWLDKSTS